MFSASKVPRDGRISFRREAIKNRRSESLETRYRGSFCPDDKKRPSSEERKSGNISCNRWSGVRKSSLNLADVKQKDTRPLTDKAYQKRKITALVTFLESRDFKYPISIAKLASPSKKDFEIIFQFLYNAFDEVYVVKKIEDEAPVLLKKLGYPFTVPKSAFQYVARTHWPVLLGVLIWLMDLNIFAMQIDVNSLFDDVGEESTRAVKIVLRYICQSHHSGNDNVEEEDEIFRQIAQSFLPDDINNLTTLNNEKKRTLMNFEKELEKIQELTEKETQINESIEKYDKYVKEMKAHIEKNLALRDQQAELLKMKEAELKELDDQVAVKQEAFDAQGFDGKKQLTYFESQRKELIEKLEKKQAVAKEWQDKFWDIEIKMKQNIDKVNDTVDSIFELHSKVMEEAKSILNPFSTFKDPQFQTHLLNFQQKLTSWEIPPYDKHTNWTTYAESALENMANSIKDTMENLKRISVSQVEKLNQIQIKMSELSNQLKLLSVRESHPENDLCSEEKKAIDEIEFLEAQQNETLKVLQTLQVETLEKERTCKAMIDELKVLEAYKENKAKELADYLVVQNVVYACISKSQQEVTEAHLKDGNEISHIFQKYLN